MKYDSDGVTPLKKLQMIYDYMTSYFAYCKAQSHTKNVEYLRIIEFPFSMLLEFRIKLYVSLTQVDGEGGVNLFWTG